MAAKIARHAITTDDPASEYIYNGEWMANASPRGGSCCRSEGTAFAGRGHSFPWGCILNTVPFILSVKLARNLRKIYK